MWLLPIGVVIMYIYIFMKGGQKVVLGPIKEDFSAIELKTKEKLIFSG